MTSLSGCNALEIVILSRIPIFNRFRPQRWQLAVEQDSIAYKTAREKTERKQHPISNCGHNQPHTHDTHHVAPEHSSTPSMGWQGIRHEKFHKGKGSSYLLSFPRISSYLSLIRHCRTNHYATMLY